MTDHVLAPDFKFGAMENWGKWLFLLWFLKNDYIVIAFYRDKKGLVVYSEKFLLFDLKNLPSHETVQVSLRILAHEIAHMWFVNLK